uniref:RAB3GAP2_N domain-containing protein n=1 Tax=Strongyloides papillosus TaxID=174720 RepID=A0A0N5C0Z5_STREA
MVTECCDKYMLEKWNLSNILVPKMTEIEIPYSDNNSVNLHSTSDYVAIIIKNEIIIYELVSGIKIMYIKYNKNIVGISSFNELFLVVAEDGTFYEIDSNYKVIKLKFMISSLFTKPMGCIMEDINNMDTSNTLSRKLIICLFKDIILLTWIESTTSNMTNYTKIPVKIFEGEGKEGEEEDEKLKKNINVVCNSDFTLLLLHYYKKNVAVVNELKLDDKISIENKICANQIHTIQFNKKEKIVDFMFDGEFLYSMTEGGIITEWKLLKNGRKYRQRQFVTSLKNCIKFLSINNRKFIIHTALKISFITINDIDQTF